MFNIKQKILISTISILATLTICNPLTSKAALQANGGDSKTNTPNTWIRAVREMETTGGTLGLNESLNSDLTSKTDSNGLDIHMEKNTEYGAMAILSASAYGNPSPVTLNSKEVAGSTTGNKTGIMGFSTEWVANAKLTDSTIPNGNWTQAKSKYKNDMVLGLVGDATTETSRWHSTSATADGFYYNGYSQANKWGGFVRANSGSIFSFSGYMSTSGSDYFHGSWVDSRRYQQVAWAENTYATRAVIVVGNAF